MATYWSQLYSAPLVLICSSHPYQCWVSVFHLTGSSTRWRSWKGYYPLPFGDVKKKNGFIIYQLSEFENCIILSRLLILEKVLSSLSCWCSERDIIFRCFNLKNVSILNKFLEIKRVLSSTICWCSKKVAINRLMSFEITKVCSSTITMMPY